MPLRQNNIESELSYAYLHAVASRAGMNCKVENRHGDDYGVDALVDYFDNIPNTYRTDVSLRVQLKATKNKGTETSTHIAYPFKFTKAEHFTRMCTDSGEPHRILAVLFLPDDPSAWLTCSPSELVLKNAAYWVCLYGADVPTTTTSKTIYLPKQNLLTPDSLVELCREIGQKNIPLYKQP